MSNTIVALATPTGRSGIGVIRLSGGDSLGITQKLIRDSCFSPKPRTAHLKQLHDPLTGDVIDEAIITYFNGPHSFTGEDVIEISCHGSPVILRQVIDICLGFDARMADAGEFSLRALANGRMNLAEAEAIRDLIDAQTTASARQAIRQMRGEFSNQLQPLKDRTSGRNCGARIRSRVCRGRFARCPGGKCQTKAGGHCGRDWQAGLDISRRGD